MLLRAATSLPLAATVLTSCASAGYAMKEPYHQVTVRRAGSEEVSGVQVVYGRHRFPRSPKSVGLMGRSYTMEMPVPEAATVVWTTADGKEHRETVEIRRHVEGKRWFDGEGEIAFEVDDTIVRVYLVRNPLDSFDEEREQIHPINPSRN